MKSSPVLVLATAAILLAACGKKAEEPVAADAASEEVAAEQAASADAATVQPEAVAFDLNRIPVSTVDPGAFPFITAPNGYLVRDETTMDLAAFPIWTGQGFHTVEGKVFMASSNTPDGKTYSRLEFQRGVDTAVKALGGVEIANSEAPNAVIRDLPDTLRSDMNLGLGSIYGNPITTYVIRRADRTIWIHLLADSSRANWAVVEAPVAPAA